MTVTIISLPELDPAAARTIVVDVDGRPAPKGSRIAGKTKAGKVYTYPASTYEKPWIGLVAEATRKVMRHESDLAMPYAVDLTFRLRKGKYAGRAHPWPTTHDLDKLARAVIDGLVRGGALSDDRHVISLTARKAWASTDENQGVRCEVRTERSV